MTGADAGLLLILMSVLLLVAGPAERLLHYRRATQRTPITAPLTMAYKFPAPEPTLEELCAEAEAALNSVAPAPPRR